MATVVKSGMAGESGINRLVFSNVSWDDYEAMLRIVGDRPVRVTYDQGSLELMSPTFGHESLGYLLGRMVDTLSEELAIAIEGGGTTTLKRQDLGEGAEPDQCYWLRENAARVLGKPKLDLAVDPPPDLAIEVDLASSSLPRLGIFAAIGIPEVWRFHGEMLHFLHLQGDAGYRAEPSSRSFPGLRVVDATRFLNMAAAMDKTAWIKAFRAFVREELIRCEEG